jgi:hypothetical protein
MNRLWLGIASRSSWRTGRARTALPQVVLASLKAGKLRALARRPPTRVIRDAGIKPE